MTKKSDTPHGLSLSEEFKEVAKRLRSRTAELEAVIEASEKYDREGNVNEPEQTNERPGRGRTPEEDTGDAGED